MIGNILFYAECQDESASRSAMASAISARRWSRANVVRLRRWSRQSSAHRTRQARPQQLPVARGQFPEQHGKPVQIVNRLSRWKRLAFLPGSFDIEPALADHLGLGASCSRRLDCRSGRKVLQPIDRAFKPRGKQLQQLPIY